MAMTKEELITVIKSNTELSDEKINEIAEKIKGSMMEEWNEKFEKLMKASENKMQKVDPEAKKDEPKWKSFGEQLQAIAKAYIPNAGPRDERLIFEDVNGKAISGSSELIGADGGFLVDPVYSKEILKVMHEVGTVYRDCRRIPVKNNSLALKAIDEQSRATGSRWGGIRAYWVAEAGTITASKPKFRMIELKLNKLAGAHYATEELLADQSALQSVTTQGFGEEFAFFIDDSVLNGTGAGQPLGVRNCGALVEKTKESGQKADTILAENITGMWNLLPAPNRVKAKWYAIQDVEPQLFRMYFSMGTGAVPVFMPPVAYGTGGLAGSPNNGSILARPLQIIEQCQALGDEGDIMLLDLSQYLIIEKGGIDATSSIHVRFLNDERTFKFILRIDGQPLWNSAITSYKGSVDRSPYVTLQART